MIKVLLFSLFALRCLGIPMWPLEACCKNVALGTPCQGKFPMNSLRPREGKGKKLGIKGFILMDQLFICKSPSRYHICEQSPHCTVVSALCSLIFFHLPCVTIPTLQALGEASKLLLLILQH